MADRKYYVIKTKKNLVKKVAVLLKSDFKRQIYKDIIDGFKNKTLYTEVY